MRQHTLHDDYVYRVSLQDSGKSLAHKFIYSNCPAKLNHLKTSEYNYHSSFVLGTEINVSSFWGRKRTAISINTERIEFSVINTNLQTLPLKEIPQGGHESD